MDEIPEDEIPQQNGGASNEDHSLRPTRLDQLSEISTSMYIMI